MLKNILKPIVINIVIKLIIVIDQSQLFFLLATIKIPVLIVVDDTS